MSESSIPTLLRELNHWNRWGLAQNKQSKWTKVPDESTRNHGRSFDATAGPSTANEGRGFVFTGGIDVPAGRVMAIDLDGCRDPETGAIAPWADHMLNDFRRSYTEVTPSGCGLRVWFICEKPPPANEFARVKVKVAKERAPNVPETKSVEWQLFGYGVPQFVTVTGEHLLSTSPKLLVVRDLEALDREWQILRKGPTRVDGSTLPAGEGPMPSLDAVEHRIEALAEPMRSAVLDANWRPLLGDDERDVSASAAFYRVVQNVLRAAHGHGTGALAFLLSRTAWGRGEVEESADPSRYARESWVAAEITRVGAKTTTPTGALFDDGFKVENWTPPVVVVLERKLARVRFVSVAELANQPRPRDLWARMLPERGFAVWYGEPKCGKSYLAIGLALAIVEGRTFLGRATLPGVVAYVAGENVAGFPDKIAATIGPERVKAAADPIHARLKILAGMPDVTAPGFVDAIVAAVADLGVRLDLLVLDTFARAVSAAGLDENSTADMGRIVHALETLRDRLGCAVLCVHHAGKSGSVRGNSALRAAVDVMARVARDSDRVSVFRVEDMRDGEPAPAITVRFGSREVAKDEHGAVLRWYVQEHSEVFDGPANHGDPTLNYLAANPSATYSALANALGVPKSTAQDLTAKLKDAGRLSRSGARGPWIVATPPLETTGSGEE